MTKKDSEKNKSYTNEHPKGVAPAPSKSKKKNLGIGDSVMSHGMQIFNPKLGKRDERLDIKNIIKIFKNIKLNKDFFK